MIREPDPTPALTPRSMVSMAAVWALLALWSRHADTLGCAVATLAILLAWGLILLAAGEAALLRRHLFIRACLAPRGWLARWLDRRALLMVWQGLRALALALLLLVTLPLLRTPQWLILLADVLLLAALTGALSHLLRNEILDRYQAALARAWAQRINAPVLWVALLVSLLFTARHDYGGLSVGAAMRHGVSQVQVGCDALAILVRAGAILESALWWSAQRLFTHLDNLPLALLAWLGFIALFGVSFVLAWAWTRLLAGLMARPWQWPTDGKVA